MAKTVTVFADSEVNQYLNTIGDELCHAADLTHCHFAVFQGDAPTLRLSIPYRINALYLSEPIVLGRGYVFVPTQLVADVDSEPELAAVLAHAIAHMALRHASRMATRNEIANLSAAGLPSNAQAQSALIPAGFMFARRFENDADTVALAILAKAGYDPAAFEIYLKKLPFDTRPSLGSAEPAPSDRIKHVEAELATLPPAAHTRQTPGFNSWKQRVSGLVR